MGLEAATAQVTVLEPTSIMVWPRPRYTLRVLFLLITVVAAVIAYHVNWIRERHAVMSRTAAAEGKLIALVNYDPSGGFRFLEDPDGCHPAGPGLLWLFGERGYSRCVVVFGEVPTEPFQLADRALTPSEEAEFARIQHLFPEAKMTAEATERPENR